MLNRYRTIVFDCDGVILNSNKVKTQAFYNTALSYGDIAAKALVDYHIAKGGISRYEKFNYFLNVIVPAGNKLSNLEELINCYACEVRKGLLSCDVTVGLSQLRACTLDSRWMIVSGGDQKELREVFAYRGLADYFDGGIFGSPASKDEIFDRELKSGNLQLPALFLGDTQYDHQSAERAGVDFVFISGWSEFTGWKEYVKHQQIQFYNSIDEFAKDSCGFHEYS
jgi:phosphoglycolate phosphatase-like HAD superfamily hydrolase